MTSAIVVRVVDAHLGHVLELAPMLRKCGPDALPTIIRVLERSDGGAWAILFGGSPVCLVGRVGAHPWALKAHESEVFEDSFAEGSVELVRRMHALYRPLVEYAAPIEADPAGWITGIAHRLDNDPQRLGSYFSSYLEG